jgi:hypothetical protein
MPSTVIAGFTYDSAREELVVVFTTGRRYAYYGVPAEVASEMRAAFSKGEFFNARVRDHYRFSRLPPKEESDLGVAE